MRLSTAASRMRVEIAGRLMRTLHWFRADLGQQDNRALEEASFVRRRVLELEGVDDHLIHGRTRPSATPRRS